MKNCNKKNNETYNIDSNNLEQEFITKYLNSLSQEDKNYLHTDTIKFLEKYNRAYITHINSPQKSDQARKDYIKLARKTKETNINLEMSIYGNGHNKINTGVPFFDHMLEAFSKHSLINLNLTCIGDTHIDYHHSVEDCGILIGQGLKALLYPVQNIERYGNGAVVMDEACVECDLDISNRAFLIFDMGNSGNGFFGKIGSFDIELIEEFFKAISFNANLSVHINLKRGKNLHHIVEATFKAFAISIRRAIVRNDRAGIPSTKGCL